MDIKQIISQLTIDEKFSLMSGKNLWETMDIERLGIPSVTVADGPNGVKKMVKDDEGKFTCQPSICYPTGSTLAATWNPELAQKIGEALGEECLSLDIDILLAPGTNIKRTPLCGRNFEYFSEDPLLSGELAAAFIDGVQSKGIGTSLKHFAANNQEYDRANVSSEVDIRTLREIYLRPFEIAVKKSKPWTVMCSYNRINGVYASENNYLLDKILRKEWGFEGIVISDWNAVHERARSLKASLELGMPSYENAATELKAAYEKGWITDEEIDSALERLLRIVFMAKESRKLRTESYDAKKHISLAKEAALEAITLLKNENDILPISKEKVKKIAVIGSFAENPVIQGGGAANVPTTEVDSPLECLKELIKDEIEIEFVAGYMTNRPQVARLDKAITAARNADMAIVFVANREKVTESEFFDRSTIKLSFEQEEVICRVAQHNPNTVVVVQAGSAIDMSAWADKVRGIVFAWYSGQTMGSALAELLLGYENPSGKIAETFPLCLEDTPAYGSYPGDGLVVWYKEGIMVGYRYYDTYKKDVLFPFGFGLSYTTFEYSDISVTPAEATDKETVTVSFKLKNTGKMKGKETVQLYVRDPFSRVLRPEKELKAFTKVELAPGEQKEIKLTLDKDAFAYYNAVSESWYVESGEFDIMVGSSSRDIRLRATVTINSTDISYT
ncbi:MAG: Thermostable beta-glucosidase B [Firmicutes bacterium ADurb.Bin193]|nr:MAG: Thermostable beta-glucosidase B [Firmicutes bacterium ADurb.Bin193]